MGEKERPGETHLGSCCCGENASSAARLDFSSLVSDEINQKSAGVCKAKKNIFLSLFSMWEHEN